MIKNSALDADSWAMASPVRSPRAPSWSRDRLAVWCGAGASLLVQIVGLGIWVQEDARFPFGLLGVVVAGVLVGAVVVYAVASTGPEPPLVAGSEDDLPRDVFEVILSAVLGPLLFVPLVAAGTIVWMLVELSRTNPLG